jgi:hypothetical protein
MVRGEKSKYENWSGILMINLTEEELKGFENAPLIFQTVWQFINALNIEIEIIEVNGKKTKLKELHPAINEEKIIEFINESLERAIEKAKLKGYTHFIIDTNATKYAKLPPNSLWIENVEFIDDLEKE